MHFTRSMNDYVSGSDSGGCLLCCAIIPCSNVPLTNYIRLFIFSSFVSPLLSTSRNGICANEKETQTRQKKSFFISLFGSIFTVSHFGFHSFIYMLIAPLFRVFSFVFLIIKCVSSVGCRSKCQDSLPVIIIMHSHCTRTRRGRKKSSRYRWLNQCTFMETKKAHDSIISQILFLRRGTSHFPCD